MTDHPHPLTETRAAYDAGREYERATNPEDDRPWEPLDEDDPLNVGDEVRLDQSGITATAVVGSVDEDGEPWTDERALIGLRRYGNWHVRRAIPELPTEDGAVIVHLNEIEAIRAKDNTGRLNDFHRLTYDAGTETWYGMDEAGNLRWTTSQEIVPGTWKVDDQ